MTNSTATRKPWASSTRRSRLPKNWQSLRKSILRRDRWQCQLRLPGCSTIATDVDHINPGDDHSEGNLQAVCSRCHTTKTITEREAARKRKAARRFRPAERHPGMR